MDDITRLRYSKFLGNGSLLVACFYLILAIATVSLSTTIIPGWSYPQLAYIPIMVGLLSIVWASFNFHFDSNNPWSLGSKIALFTGIGLILLIISQVFILIKESPIIIFAIIGNGVLLISCILLALGFRLLHRQLIEFYLNKFITKKSNLNVFYGFLLQSLAYLVYLISWFIPNELASQIINIIGMVIAGISVIAIVIGCFQIHLIFRTFQQLIIIQLQEKMKTEN